MRLLDLYCAAGGASKGYAAVGFDVTGVDHRPQPRYPYRFIQGDALEYVARHGHEYDAIHASPPCQVFTRAGHLMRAQGRTTAALDLVAPTRDALLATGRPYVIENVEGSPLLSPLLLCGSSFGLRVRRHRLFESNVFLMGTPCRHAEQGRPIGIYYRMGDEIPCGGRTARTLDEAREAMGIEWMTWPELTQAIPPAYTQFIGQQLRQALEWKP